MDETEKIINKVISKSDMLWQEIDENNQEIFNFIEYGSLSDFDKFKVYLYIALKLVIIELNIDKNLDNKKKTEFIDIKEDLLNLTEGFPQQIIKFNPVSFKEYKQKIEEMRFKMWENIKSYKYDLEEILISWTECYIENKIKSISDNETDLLLECLFTVYLENWIRKKELSFLEMETYGRE